MRCPECNFELSANAAVCPRCFTPLAPQVSDGAETALAIGAPPAPLAPAANDAAMTDRMRRLMQGPTWTTRRTQLALTLLLLGVALIVLLAAVLSVSRRGAKYYLQRGDAYYQAGQYELAQAAYLHALDRDERLAAAESGLGLSYLKLNRPAMAIPHLNQAVSMDPQLIDSHRGLGIAYSAVQMNLEAEASLKSALKIAPDDLDASRTLGVVYYQQQRYEEAIALLEKVSAAQADDAAALEYLGRSLYAQGRYDEAVGPLEAAVGLAPDVESAREHLALAWYELARYDKALEHLATLRAAHPTDPIWYAYTGQALYKQGDLEGAAAHLDHALTLARADLVLADSHRSLGWIAYREKNYDRAMPLFQRALIMDPFDAEAMAGLGWTLAQTGRCAEAKPFFTRALELDEYLEAAQEGVKACP